MIFAIATESTAVEPADPALAKVAVCPRGAM